MTVPAPPLALPPCSTVPPDVDCYLIGASDALAWVADLYAMLRLVCCDRPRRPSFEGLKVTENSATAMFWQKHGEPPRACPAWPPAPQPSQPGRRKRLAHTPPPGAALAATSPPRAVHVLAERHELKMSFLLKMYPNTASLKVIYDGPAAMAAITPDGHVLGTE